jgi:hypothetical protein
MPDCPKCEVPLEGGFQLSHSSSGPSVAEWIEGAPEKSFWGLKTSGRRKLKMYAWRCPRCAEVRMFAPEE